MYKEKNADDEKSTAEQQLHYTGPRVEYATTTTTPNPFLPTTIEQSLLLLPTILSANKPPSPSRRAVEDELPLSADPFPRLHSGW